MKLQSYLEMKLRISEEDATKLGKKDPEVYPLMLSAERCSLGREILGLEK